MKTFSTRAARALASLVLAALTLSACEPTEPELHILLRSDLQPGAQFDRVDVTLWPLGDGTDLTTTGPARGSVPALLSLDDAAVLLDQGLRVARFAGLVPGRYVGEITLHSGTAFLVRNRFVATYEGVDLVLPVHVDALCVGVECPSAGTPAGFIACSGGQCVDPQCFEDPEGVNDEGVPYCGSIERCDGGDECAAIADCADPTCLDGFCSSRPRADACPEGEYCNVLEGCVRIPPPGSQRRCDTFCDLDEQPCHLAQVRCSGGTIQCDAIGLRRPYYPCPGGICDGAGTCVPCETPDDPGTCLPTCLPGQTECSDGCFDLSTSATHCGGCSSECASGELCSSGGCVTSCGPGQEECDGGCHDLRSAPDHCGACGAACEMGEVCSDGACALSCGGDTPTLCGRSCVDVDRDRLHCGGCGIACGTGEVCVLGACATECPATQIVCDGRCVDPRTDRRYCGVDDACAGGSVCGAGDVCVAGACAASCPPGQLACAGRCVDPLTSRTFCGTTDCTDGRSCGAGELCSTGRCETSCPPGQLACDGECVDPSSDRAYCGTTDCADGMVCSAGEVCSAGGCETSCPVGQLACDDRCVDPLTSRAYCGTTDCTDGAVCGAGEVCSVGSCETSCPGGQIACAGGCVDPDSNRFYCGAYAGCASGATCASGEVCVLGSCETSCPTGQLACAGGCVDPLTDRTYCGTTDCADGTVCGAGEVCVLGSCETSCPPGQLACGGGCVDPLTDRDYCGAHADCTGGAACGSGQLCVTGACQLSCPLGQYACGGGCVDPLTDRTYCGVGPDCVGGESCVAGEVCSLGACATSCPMGQVVCFGACVDPLTSRAFCGVDATCAGGTTCGGGQVCSGGSCAPSCAPPFAVCGSGCADVRYDPSHCGACNAPCGKGFACYEGVCLRTSGFTGGVGTEWRVSATADWAAMTDFVTIAHRGPFGFDAAGFAAFDRDLATWSTRPPPPQPIAPPRTNAIFDGFVYTIVPPVVYAYDIDVARWETPFDRIVEADVGAMTISDGASVWTYAGESLVRYHPAFDAYEPFPARIEGGPRSPRLGYDGTRDRIVFGASVSPRLYAFSIGTSEIRDLSAIPSGRLGEMFCADRDGHFYASGEPSRSVYQYDIATDRWELLPIDLPMPHGERSSCTVLESGVLLVNLGTAGEPMYEIDLERY